MTLKDWEQNNKWLVSHQTSKAEVASLIAVGDRSLKDSRVDGLSSDAQLALAYSAGLQYAIAALAAAGYRPARGGDHHFHAIQTLTHTLRWAAKDIRRFDAFRKKRNMSSYERAGDATAAEVQEMQELASTLRTNLDHWLKTEHKELL